MAWNGSSQTAQPIGNSNRRTRCTPVARSRGASPIRRGMLAGLIVVVGGGVVVWLMLGRFEKSADPQRNGKSRSQIEQAAPQIVTNVPAAAVEETPEQIAKRQRGEKLKAMSPRERVDFLFKEAKKKKINLEPASNRVYATGTEQVMDWVFTTQLGDMPPILPKLPRFEEAHLIEILANQNEVRETDSARVRDGKEMVMLAKEELAKYLAEGGTAQEFLSYYHDKLREAHMQYQETERSVMKLAREEPEMLQDYLESVNKSLAEKGIKPVTIPRPLARHFGLELEDKYLRGKPKE